MIWRCSRFEFDTKMPIVMGILNVTPDSFSDGGTHADHDEAVAHASVSYTHLDVYKRQRK